jgi:hypothetical protein
MQGLGLGMENVPQSEPGMELYEVVGKYPSTHSTDSVKKMATEVS